MADDGDLFVDCVPLPEAAPVFRRGVDGDIDAELVYRYANWTADDIAEEEWQHVSMNLSNDAANEGHAEKHHVAPFIGTATAAARLDNGGVITRIVLPNDGSAAFRRAAAGLRDGSLRGVSLETLAVLGRAPDGEEMPEKAAQAISLCGQGDRPGSAVLRWGRVGLDEMPPLEVYRGYTPHVPPTQQEVFPPPHISTAMSAAAPPAAAPAAAAPPAAPAVAPPANGGGAALSVAQFEQLTAANAKLEQANKELFEKAQANEAANAALQVYRAKEEAAIEEEAEKVSTETTDGLVEYDDDKKLDAKKLKDSLRFLLKNPETRVHGMNLANAVAQHVASSSRKIQARNDEAAASLVAHARDDRHRRYAQYSSATDRAVSYQPYTTRDIVAPQQQQQQLPAPTESAPYQRFQPPARVSPPDPNSLFASATPARSSAHDNGARAADQYLYDLMQ